MLPYFNGMSLLYFGKFFCRIENQPEIAKFIRWAVACDSLKDVDDDLRAGLVLFRRNLLDKKGVKLTPGEKVPVEMTQVLNEVRKTALIEGKERCQAVFKTEWPWPFQFALYCYLKRKVHNMGMLDLKISEGLVFAQGS